VLASRCAPSLPHTWRHCHCRLPHAHCGIVVCRLPHARCGISVVVFLIPGMASSLLSSSCPGSHLRCRLPHAHRSIVACRLPYTQRGIAIDECQDPALTTLCSSTGNVDFVLRSRHFYSHFRCTHTSGVLTLPAYSDAARTHMPYVGSLSSWYRSRPVCSPSRPYSHALHGLVVFSHTLRGLVVPVVSIMPGVLFVVSVLTRSA